MSRISVVDSSGNIEFVGPEDSPKAARKISEGGTRVDSVPPSSTRPYLWQGGRWVVDTVKEQAKQNKETQKQTQNQAARQAFSDFKTLVNSSPNWQLGTNLDDAMRHIRDMFAAGLNGGNTQ